MSAADSLTLLNLLANSLAHGQYLPQKARAAERHHGTRCPVFRGRDEIASTRAAWQDLPQSIKDKAEATASAFRVAITYGYG